MSNKAVRSAKSKLKDQIKLIQNSKDETELYQRVNVYNSMVMEIHNYYGIANNVCINLSSIQRNVSNESCIVYIAKVNGVNVATCVSVDPGSGEKKIMSCYPLEDQSDSETITIESPAGPKFYDKNMPKDGSDKDNFLNVLKSQEKGGKFMLTISVNDIPTI